MTHEKPVRPETRQLVREILAAPSDPNWRSKVARAILDRKQLMAETEKPWSMQLPNGVYLYPRLYQSIIAFRNGEPPDLQVVFECRTAEGEVEIERVSCESWEEADAVGRAFASAMAEFFPELPLAFGERKP